MEATMSDAPTPSRYSAPAQLFHWLTVLCVAATWTIGTLRDDFPKGSIRDMATFVHVSLGELIVLLLVLRIVWRFLTPTPPLEPTGLGTAGEVLAKLGHLAIYGLLLAVPVVGVVMVFHGGKPLPLFGLAEIPSPWLQNRELRHYSKEIHELLANLLMAAAGLHAAAALAHHHVLKDRTLKRMLPAVLIGD
jgi:cytochrome b561